MSLTLIFRCSCRQTFDPYVIPLLAQDMDLHRAEEF
jgi:hypothetical protein